MINNLEMDDDRAAAIEAIEAAILDAEDDGEPDWIMGLLLVGPYDGREAGALVLKYLEARGFTVTRRGNK